MGSVSITGALGAVAFAILFAVGTIFLLCLWVLDIVVLQIAVDPGAFAIAAFYEGLPLLELAALTYTVVGTGALADQSCRARCLRLASILWLCDAINVLLIARVAPALIFPPPRTTGLGPAYATTVLLDSLPDPWTSPRHDQYGGMAQFTANELNRIHWGARFGAVTYVPANLPSTDPETVSVNPIDNYTWGAAAYSVRARRCYVILAVHDKNNPGYGSTFYGRLAPGAPCAGAAATPETARFSSSLPE